MKFLSILPVAFTLLPSSYAWIATFTNANGVAVTKSGTGPHACIAVDNGKDQVFDINAQGEKNINMLLYNNTDCSGDPIGSATEEFTKKASVRILGFEVVDVNAKTNSTSTSTETTTKSGSKAQSTGGSSTTTASVTNSSVPTTSASSTPTTNTSATNTSTSSAATKSSAGNSYSRGEITSTMVGLVFGLMAFEWLI